MNVKLLGSTALVAALSFGALSTKANATSYAIVSDPNISLQGISANGSVFVNNSSTGAYSTVSNGIYTSSADPTANTSVNPYYVPLYTNSSGNSVGFLSNVNQDDDTFDPNYLNDYTYIDGKLTQIIPAYPQEPFTHGFGPTHDTSTDVNYSSSSAGFSAITDTNILVGTLDYSVLDSSSVNNFYEGSCGYVVINGVASTCQSYAGSNLTSFIASSDNGVYVIGSEKVDPSSAGYDFSYSNGVYTLVDYPGSGTTTVTSVGNDGTVGGYTTDGSGNAVDVFTEKNGTYTGYALNVPGATGYYVTSVNPSGYFVGGFTTSDGYTSFEGGPGSGPLVLGSSIFDASNPGTSADAAPDATTDVPEPGMITALLAFGFLLMVGTRARFKPQV